MLDVHAPHGPVHSWRDFLVHIAAIAIGLLLALALEKLVEYIHERRQLTEARRELVMEVAENRRTWAINVTEASRIQQELDADLKIIQAVRVHAPIGDGKFDYSVDFHATLDGPWQAVRIGTAGHRTLGLSRYFHSYFISQVSADAPTRAPSKGWLPRDVVGHQGRFAFT